MFSLVLSFTRGIRLVVISSLLLSPHKSDIISKTMQEMQTEGVRGKGKEMIIM